MCVCVCMYVYMCVCVCVDRFRNLSFLDLLRFFSLFFFFLRVNKCPGYSIDFSLNVFTPTGLFDSFLLSPSLSLGSSSLFESGNS